MRATRLDRHYKEADRPIPPPSVEPTESYSGQIAAARPEIATPPAGRARQARRGEPEPWLGPEGPGLDPPRRTALDRDGAVVGYVFESKGFSRIDIDTNESEPAYSLAGRLTAAAS